MKLKFLSPLVAAAVLFSSSDANATFTVNLRTSSTDSTYTSGNVPSGTRLWNGLTTGDGAETTDPLWFVIDVDGDGIFNASWTLNKSFDGTIGGLLTAMIDANDFVFQGTVNSGVDGRTLQPVTLPSNAQTGGSGPADIGGTIKAGYAILFDDANLLNGGSYGFDQVAYNNPDGSTVIPTSGNINARIGQDTFSGTTSFSVVAVPEPSSIGLLAGLGLGAVSLLRRRATKA